MVALGVSTFSDEKLRSMCKYGWCKKSETELDYVNYSKHFLETLPRWWLWNGLLSPSLTVLAPLRSVHPLPGFPILHHYCTSTNRVTLPHWVFSLIRWQTHTWTHHFRVTVSKWQPNIFIVWANSVPCPARHTQHVCRLYWARPGQHPPVNTAPSE